MDLNRLVEQYKTRYKAILDDLVDYYQGLESIEEAIKRAARGEGINGELHSHQYLMWVDARRRAPRILLAAKGEICSCNSFEELIRIVEDKTSDLKGFGILAVYDASLRIGAKLGIYPTKIYLHRGVKVGCKNLGLNVHGKKALEVDDFPSPIKLLKPYHIENFMCIYREDFLDQGRTITHGCIPRKNNCH